MKHITDSLFFHIKIATARTNMRQKITLKVTATTQLAGTTKKSSEIIKKYILKAQHLHLH